MCVSKRVGGLTYRVAHHRRVHHLAQCGGVESRNTNEKPPAKLRAQGSVVSKWGCRKAAAGGGPGCGVPGHTQQGACAPADPQGTDPGGSIIEFFWGGVRVGAPAMRPRAHILCAGSLTSTSLRPAFLAQATLQEAYKSELKDCFGIVFNSLFTITNMPIKRFADFLYQRDELASYMQVSECLSFSEPYDEFLRRIVPSPGIHENHNVGLCHAMERCERRWRRPKELRDQAL